MDRVQNGDLAYLEELFRRHADGIHVLCARLVSRDAAEELVQESFLRLLRYRGSWRRQGSFAGWLYSIARNLCRDYLQRERRESAATLTWTQDQRATREDPRVQLVEIALVRLPADQREVIVLARWHDLSSARIGEILGCSAGAARVRLHRALRQMRELVQQLEANDHELRRSRSTERG
jgi:RNA polymerase sigma-70 factor (ECF subfamily)